MADPPTHDDDDIPAFIRGMLDPFVNVDGPRRPASGNSGVEPTYIPPLFRVTNAQLQAMGRISSTWSVLEHMIEIVLSRLCLAPQFPTLALTTNLSIDNRLKAIKALTALHRERYRLQVFSENTLNAIDALTKQIAIIKDDRNRVVHLVWTKHSPDKMVGRRPRALTASATQRTADPELSLADVNSLADQIQELADNLFGIVQLMPEVDEGSLVQSPSPSARHRHRDEG